MNKQFNCYCTTCCNIYGQSSCKHGLQKEGWGHPQPLRNAGSTNVHGMPYSTPELRNLLPHVATLQRNTCFIQEPCSEALLLPTFSHLKCPSFVKTLSCHDKSPCPPATSSTRPELSTLRPNFGSFGSTSPVTKFKFLTVSPDPLVQSQIHPNSPVQGKVCFTSWP